MLNKNIHAEVVEQADAPDSKSGEGNLMRVQFPPSAPFLSNLHNYLYFKVTKSVVNVKNKATTFAAITGSSSIMMP